MPTVEFKNVDIMFGEKPEVALGLLDQGKTRDEILSSTGNVLGVADANLAVEQGEICVLMGLSGSGKSTLLRAVNGLNKVSRGQVLIEHEGEAVDVVSCSSQVLRTLRTTRVAMVFQQFALLPWRTVRENVGFGLELRGLSKSDRRVIVDEKLDIVGLTQWADKYAHELSGGMQQRVGLARAFATDADILLMDEPFSALDPLIRDKLQDELLELQQRLKKTIIFVSHDLDEALKIGSHISIMESGRIVQTGEPEEIVLNPANEYVTEFVAHMNPLNVLRGGSLMTPVSKLTRNGDWLELDGQGRHAVSLDAQGRPIGLRLEGGAGDVVQESEGLIRSGLNGQQLVVAPVGISMRRVIELRQASGLPVVLMDGNSVAGVCGDREIYQGILRQGQTD